MEKIFEKYIQAISSKFSHEETSEMGYRADFEILLKGIFESVNDKHIAHDPKAKQGNKPDFVVLSHDVPILYIEAKDIGVSLDKIEKSDQMARYFGYANLVLTDYIEFRFYRNGLRYQNPIYIADYNKKKRTIKPKPENYKLVAKTLLDFTQSHKEPIKSGEHLAKIMGGKARRIRDNVRQFLSTESKNNDELVRVYETLKKLLVHDLTQETFADMYAQTLVYGLFAARYHDETLENFSRQEARDLVPKSNPFLRHFFDHIVGPNFDKRLEYIVDELCQVFSYANVQELMKQYFKNDLWGKIYEGPDPVIHFYEDFLKEYDPDLRKKLGAYYTPLPVVRFIVNSVDLILKKEFNLTAGLADTSKLANDIHKVQILDPAVGTGTFISAVIRIIYKWLLEKNQKGRWTTYVHNDLLPRLHGFELMMAPYTIAHLKLSMAFKETGFKHFNRRLGIYLTNSLEPSTAQDSLFTGFGFAESIAEESKEASVIKNEAPIMVIIGNPPYSGESSNAVYKENDVYKVEPTGGKLKERNSKWLNDDYVKFIRLAECFIEKNQSGIVAMITAHGYIDNPTFRGMRWHLMNTFDKIYVLDLHGNANKKETAPDGSVDQNVFDIKQGVAIFIGIKKSDKKNEPADILRADLLGNRQSKFKSLSDNDVDSIKWQIVKPSKPNYEWVVRDEKLGDEYNQGFSVAELFSISSVGIVTSRDKFVIDEDKEALIDRINKFLRSSTPQEALTNFELKENKKWKATDALNHVFDKEYVKKISYRPFDDRFVYYHDEFIERSRSEVMKHFLKQNLALVVVRQVKAGQTYQHVFVSRNITESTLISNKTSEIDYVMPLFAYLDNDTKKPNFNNEIVNKIGKIVGQPEPEDIFDYIYATLHSPSYREKYKEFLRTGYPRVPYPKDKVSFEKLVELGHELRSLHLFESSKVNQFITTYPIIGSDIVEKLTYKDGKVFINKDQYFGNLPESAWNFYIGAYQPAKKWLKDRKDRKLTNADIEHYQKIIVALIESDKVMKKIDENITSQT